MSNALSHRGAPSAHATSRSNAALQRAILVSAMLLLAVLLVQGARMTAAGIADYQTRAFLADWEAKAAEPTPRAWAVALGAAERAVAVYPVPNGPYLERLGYVHAWQQFRQPFGAQPARASRIAARDAFRAAVQSRPTWPQGWAALASVKLQLLEFDAEFHHALATARRLGPWRPDVNRRLAETGFIAWPSLDAGERDATLESARRSLLLDATGAAQVFTLAEAAGQREVLCRQLEEALLKRASRHCGG